MKKLITLALIAYAHAALASFVGRPPLEVLAGPLFKGQSMIRTTGSAPFAGRTALASGTAFVTISTQAVNSDSIIYGTLQVATQASSGTLGTYAVSSIVAGVSFAYGALDGQGRAPGGTVMWEIRRTT